MFFSNSVIFFLLFRYDVIPPPNIPCLALVYHLKLCEFQQKLLGADILELDGGFGVVACALESEDFASTKAVVEDKDPLLQSSSIGRKTMRRGSRLRYGRHGSCCRNGLDRRDGWTERTRFLISFVVTKQAATLCPGKFHFSIDASTGGEHALLLVQIFRVDVFQETAGRGELHLTVAEAALGIGKVAMGLGSGDGDVEKSAFLFHLARIS